MSHDSAMPTGDTSTARSYRTIVVKLGGSLLDLPDLADRLQVRISALRTPRIILVIGGGTAADLVRRRDKFDMLGHDKSHWLAIRAMTFNSFLVEALLPNSTVVASVAECQVAWEAGRVPILDPHAFMFRDDTTSRWPLPHSWSVTSDSIAARVAEASDAAELVLLKSVAWPDGRGLEEAVRQGIVDEHLLHESQRLPDLRVRIEDLRSNK